MRAVHVRLWLVAVWFGLAGVVPAARAEVVTIEALEDPTGRLDRVAVAAAGGWRQLNEPVLGVGFTASAWWLRITVPPGRPPLVLEIERPYVNYVDFYRPAAGGDRVSRAGAMQPIRAREIDYRHPAFRLTGDPGAATVYYLRAASAGSLMLPLRVQDEASFVAGVAQENFGFGLYFGVAAIMALYNLFLYFGVRDRAYLWYVIYVAALGLFLFAHLGLAALWWWPESGWLATRFVYPCMAIGMMAYLQYVRALFGTATTTPRLDRALVLVAALGALAVLPLLADSIRGSIFVMYAHIVAVIGVSLTVGVVFWRRRFRPAIYFLLAFAVLWMAGLAAIARATGLTDGFAFLANHGVLIGSSAEVLLFALALADRINLLKREKDTALAVALRNQETALRAARESEQALERRVAERTEALARARDAAQQANRAKTGFLAAASHDLRQPMHALGLLVAALRARVLEPQASALLERIDASVTAMDQLLGALLDVSRLDSGTVVPERTAVPLQRLFDGLAAAFAPEAEASGLRLRLRPTDAVVDSDPVLLDRILRNLVANAVRHTPAGRVLVGVRRRGQRLRIEIHDTGHGIPPDRRQDIFQEFVRLAPASPQGARGMGLGLSIVSRLCSLLGHRLDVTSTLGRGSCFAIEVPLVSAKSGSAGTQALTPPRPTARSTHDVAVLVIDDDAAIAAAMRAMLEAAHCRVTTAGSVAEAEAAVLDLQHRLDLLVVDYRLAAGETGLDAVDRVHAILDETVPVLMITGETSQEALAPIAARGYPVCFKPVGAERLLRAMDDCLSGRASSPNPSDAGEGDPPNG